eukprot:jgi/Mesvir1/15085/Mv14727-RA.1
MPTGARQPSAVEIAEQVQRAGSATQWLKTQLSPESPRREEKALVVRTGRQGELPPQPPFTTGGNERMYEAYNELHNLAQSFRKPFDAPAIVVVGHQTDGKSALVEAFIGFQFNHVGGGTKTRRPITLHMKYNPSCQEPKCFLIDDFREERKTLQQLQDYIEAENLRLEREEIHFWSKEIIVRFEYKYCPNLTIIDTPGLIAAPPGKRNAPMQAAAAAVEELVLAKLASKEFIILCVEDVSDWNNATTRRVVMKADPDLSRTVLVSTKFDTRLPQFGRSVDAEMFTHPPPAALGGGEAEGIRLLGGRPFFTSVPSGRVGTDGTSVFRTHDEFKEAVAMRESMDVRELERIVDRGVTPEERAHIGISRLRVFLEQLLQQQYLENVPTIIPLLEKELRTVSDNLASVNKELEGLDMNRLRDRGRTFRENFVSKLAELLKGTVSASGERFGETLADERIRGGAFVDAQGAVLPTEGDIPNAHMRLFGGAQYHRAMAEFRAKVGGLRCPPIDLEQLVNACGVDDVHDGVNYTRTACVVAVTQARTVLEPYLHQLGFRLTHILRRMLPISMHMLQAEGQFMTGHQQFLKRVGSAFRNFVDETEASCRKKCIEDLHSTTRFVTWSLHNQNHTVLRPFLDEMGKSARGGASTLASLSMLTGNAGTATANGAGKVGSKTGGPDGKDSAVDAAAAQHENLMALLEATLWSRRLGTLSEQIVNVLVTGIFEGIRNHFVVNAELKFNCFFLMPLVDTFPQKLRTEIEAAFEKNDVFDVDTVRASLEAQKDQLEAEVKRVEKLQAKFVNIHHNLTVKSAVP